MNDTEQALVNGTGIDEFIASERARDPEFAAKWDKQALTEVVAKALCDFDVDNNGGYVWEYRGDSWGSDYENGRDYYRDMATACLPIIDRLIAEKLADKAHEIKEL